MLFNKSNTVQKNWRMVKKGKVMAFGCTLFFATGLALAAPAHATDKAVESKTTVTTGEVSTPKESVVAGGNAVSNETTSPKEAVASEKNSVPERNSVSEKTETSEKNQDVKKLK